jgi:hypothetical protein
MARVISNSGGRTSGMMTLLEMQKGLGPDDYVVFCNTGMEDEETYKFLHRQQTVLGVPLRWIEYCPTNRWREVDFYSASRNGEPFVQMMLKKQAVPSGHMGRFCTTELKIKAKVEFMRSQGHPYFEAVVGIRADEPARHFAGKDDKRHYVTHPLYHAGITRADVLKFWRGQPFDLEADALAGNCTLCFGKGMGKKVALLERRPELAQWWIDVEKAMGHPFSLRYSMQALADLAEKRAAHRAAAPQATIDFFPNYDEPSISCFGCTD